MGQINRTIQVWATIGLSVGTMAMAIGCTGNSPAQSNAGGIRGDVTDVRPLATAAPVSYQPPAFDTTGVVPTAPQPITPDPVVTTTPAAVDTTTTVVSSTTHNRLMGEKTHKVHKGETLFSIAKNTYGDGKAWKKIVSANPGLTPAKLKVGQVLTMPA